MKKLLFLLPLLLFLVIPVYSQSNDIRFAVMGDFGHEETGGTQKVADFLHRVNPEFIVTVGDNCYYISGQFDRCIGKYYHDFIFPYNGTYGPGATVNKLFPAMGNHDWEGGVTAYTQYFTLPGNERYYDFVRGPVHFFIVDSDSREPDGNTCNSPQIQNWLRPALLNSTAIWKFVFFHHPPYSSGSQHGGSPVRDCQYYTWGADVVFSGHEHNYERIFRNNIVYYVVGTGGRSLYNTWLNPLVQGSQFHIAEYGALIADVNNSQARFRFFKENCQDINICTPLDDFTLFQTITATPVATNTRTPTRTVTPTRTQTATPNINPNLALNKPATVSSVDNALRQGSQAVDGNYGTRWSSVYTNNQWIQIDLGNVVNISQVILTWEVAYGKSYRIEVSNDALNWTTIFSTTTGDGGTDNIFLTGLGRYVRMFGTEKATQYGFSLWEFEIYGEPLLTPNPTVTSSLTVSLSPTFTSQPTTTLSRTLTIIPSTVTATLLQTSTPIATLNCPGRIVILNGHIECYGD